MAADDPLSLLQDDDDYNSASDEEFDPTAAAAAAANDDDDAFSSSSSSDDEASKPRKGKGNKRKRAAAAAADLDSGDEATIAATKKQRHSTSSDDEGGEGGLIKTRAQRRTERKERRPLARVDGATADVDAIWAALSSAPVGKPSPGGTTPTVAEEEKEGRWEDEPVEELEVEMITIKRTYNFAGDRITEERQVPKASAEARLYLAQQQERLDKEAGKKAQEAAAAAAVEAEEEGGAVEGEGKGEEQQEKRQDKPSIRRPLRRASRFDPNPLAEVRGLPPEKQLTWARRRALLDPATAVASLPAAASAPAGDAQAVNAAAKKSKEKAQKLNTVDKSRLDWAGYVDKEGIAEELDEYGRAKEGYLGRMDFLERVDQRKEEERRTAKAALKT